MLRRKSPSNPHCPLRVIFLIALGLSMVLIVVMHNFTRVLDTNFWNKEDFDGRADMILLDNGSLCCRFGCPRTLLGKQLAETDKSERNISHMKSDEEEGEDDVEGNKPTYGQLRAFWELELSDDNVLRRAERCQGINLPGFIGDSSNNTVPLAYSITVHTDLGILESLLSLIFRPYHSICLHVDSKASQQVVRGVRLMVDCYKKQFPSSNIFTVPNPLEVYWGHISLLQADLTCLELLLSSSDRWRYFLNLAGSELPRFSSEHIERQLEKYLTGKSLIISHSGKRHGERTKYKYELGEWSIGAPSGLQDRVFPQRTSELKSPPPYGLTIFKGAKNVILNRTYADFLLHHSVPRTLLEWLQDTLIPDEAFFATMVRVTIGDDNENLWQYQDTDAIVPSYLASAVRHILPRYTQWILPKDTSKCMGVIKREICNFDVFALPHLARLAKKSIVVNKFDLTVDPVAVACWHEFVGDS